MPLTKGTSIDGDGAVLQLGYYTNGSANKPFDGLFVPLTGTGASHSFFGATSSGNSDGGWDGRFSLVFHLKDAAQAHEQSLPPAGTPLVIRFFNSPALSPLRQYNEVSGGALWAWQAPSVFPGTILFLSLLDSPLFWKDGPDSAFRTTLQAPSILDPLNQTPPVLSALPEQTTLSTGQSLELRVTATGTEPVTFQWYKDDAFLAGSTGLVFSLPALSLTDAGTYKVTATNSGGSSSRRTVVRVLEPPTFRTLLSNRTVNLGESASFVADVSGTPPFTYQWYKSGRILQDATTAELRIPVVGPGDLDKYTVVVSGAAGQIESPPVSLLLLTPVTITLQPTSVSVDAGADVRLKVDASGTPPISYQWRKAGVPIQGANQKELALAALQVKDAGLYSVEVSNPVGSILSGPAVLTVGGVVGSLISSQPKDAKTLRGSKATQLIALLPESGQVLKTTYRVHTFKGQTVGGPVSGVGGTVPKDGGLQLPLGALPNSGQYIVRFSRVSQTDKGNQTAEFDSVPFQVESKAWTSLASSYLGLLTDINDALGDDANYRGLVSLTITRSGGVSAKLTYVEAPLMEGESVRRAYLPVTRQFAGAFQAVPDAPSRFVFTSAKPGVRSGQELTVELDSSSALPEVSMTVSDYRSLNGATYQTKAVQCLRNADKSVLPAALPSARFLLQSEDRAQFLIRTTSSGSLLWTSRVAGVAGSGSTALRIAPEGSLNAPIFETSTKNSKTAVSSKAVLGMLHFSRSSDGQAWGTAFGTPSGPAFLEHQSSQLVKKQGVLVWDAGLAAANGLRLLEFENAAVFRWNLGSALKPGGALSPTTQFLFSAQDPVNPSETSPSYQWKVSFTASGAAKVSPVSTAAGASPTLSLRLDKLTGALNGSFLLPKDKMPRSLFGAGALDASFSAWGWTEKGMAPSTLSAEWSLIPSP